MLPQSFGIWNVRATPRAGDLWGRSWSMRSPAQADLAGVGAVETREQIDRGRLARAVGPDEPADLALAHAEGKPVDGDQPPEPLGEPARLDGAQTICGAIGQAVRLILVGDCLTACVSFSRRTIRRPGGLTMKVRRNLALLVVLLIAVGLLAAGPGPPRSRRSRSRSACSRRSRRPATPAAGQFIVRGAKMAAEDVNARGGVLGGRKIELVVEDDSGTPEKGVGRLPQARHPGPGGGGDRPVPQLGDGGRAGPGRAVQDPRLPHPGLGQAASPRST